MRSPARIALTTVFVAGLACGGGDWSAAPLVEREGTMYAYEGTGPAFTVEVPSSLRHDQFASFRLDEGGSLKVGVKFDLRDKPYTLDAAVASQMGDGRKVFQRDEAETHWGLASRKVGDSAAGVRVIMAHMLPDGGQVQCSWDLYDYDLVDETIPEWSTMTDVCASFRVTAAP